VGIICTLAFATLLAPAEEARIHTLTSLFKHVTFGAWFGAIAAGWLLHFLTRLRLKKAWSYVVNTIFSTVFTLGSIPLLVVGTHQAYELHNNWWNSTRVVNALRPLVTNLNRPVLMDDASVAEYYLQNRLPLPFWHDQYYSAFTPAGTTKKIFGLHAYADAVRQGWFGVIALDWAKKRQDNAIASAISQSKRYAWVGNFTSGGATSQRTTYVVWQLRRSKS
jgi:hypothetical protein